MAAAQAALAQRQVRDTLLATLAHTGRARPLYACAATWASRSCDAAAARASEVAVIAY